MATNPNPTLANQPLAPTATRKSITGFVTKLVGDGATYGFINDEIFFQQANVIGGPVGVNDRVFAECEYSAHLPIKWNATSIKILTRASSSSTSSSGPPGGILDSDPRRQSRQAMLLNQQQQQPQHQPQQSQQQPSQFSATNQPPQNAVPVANTYQQHRQQKQMQQQNLLPNQHDVSMNNQLQQQPPSIVPIEASMNQAPEFFTPFAQPTPMTQPLGEILPFETPMGPPKLEYTSQLGSAFVQNQYMPGPILTQTTAAPLLPQARQSQSQQSQQQPQQQSQQQQQQQQHHQQNRRERNQQNKNNFNNDKNDRNSNNRGRNRNDNKFDQGRNINERDNSNNRSSRAGSNSRDRSGSRVDNNTRNDRETNKREGIVSRPSPQRNSARSTASVSSERSNKSSSRRHYDPQNIPRTNILSNMNAWNMRSRCPSSIHVPSDLKNVIVNAHLRLDIRNLPKPLTFKIETVTSDDKPEDKSEQDNDDAKKETETEIGDSESKPIVAIDTVSNDESSQVGSIKKENDSTSPSSKSEIKLNHKYGVKVVLISLPELEAIYKKVFGSGLDSFTSDSKNQSRLDEAISLLCNKGSNGGHSLLGGKFDPNTDGFIEDETNEFERHGRQPDLIATCKRVVLDQAGLDLQYCQSWTLVSTFIYNNKSDYFTPKASVEYSYIYMPHIWSMTNTNLDTGLIGEESTNEDVSVILENVEKDENLVTEAAIVTETKEEVEAIAAVECAPVNQVTLNNLADLKVVDLKVELDKRGLTYKPNTKKAELVAALQTSMETEITSNGAPDSIEEDQSGDVAINDTEDQLEEGEVVASEGTTPTDEMNEDPIEKDESSDPASKRKAEDEPSEQHDTKKIKEDNKKTDQRVEIIKESFVVHSRKGQQQLSLVNLYDATQVSRYDQFELSVTSNILKESLVQHLSEYIFTTLIEDHRVRIADQAGVSSTSSSAASTANNSQEINNSDTNNNKTIAPKNPQKSSDKTSTTLVSKEYPVDRYINLAFSYFDSTHIGYLNTDDLSKLFCNTGLTISKRALLSLVGDCDKFNYRTLNELSPKLAPTYIYRFPDQFIRLPGTSAGTVGETSSEYDQSASTKMVEYQGVKYNVESLVQQVKEAETTRVNMVERFNHAIENFDKQAAEIHVLEVSRASLSKSIKALNDELSEARRGRESSEKKLESLKGKLTEMLAEIERK